MEKEQIKENINAVGDKAKKLLNSEGADKAKKITRKASCVVCKVGKAVLYVLTVLVVLGMIYYYLGSLFCGGGSVSKPTFKEYKAAQEDKKDDAKNLEKLEINKKYSDEIAAICKIADVKSDDVVDRIAKIKNRKKLDSSTLTKFVDGMVDFLKDGQAYAKEKDIKPAKLIGYYQDMFLSQYEKVEQDKELGKRKCAIAKIKALRNLNLALILICTIQLITIARNTSKKEC